MDDLFADALAAGVEHVAADAEDLRGAGEVDAIGVCDPDLAVHDLAAVVLDVQMTVKT